MDSLVQDIRYSFRALARNPGLFLIAVLTLAVGIGATTSVFSVVDRILFRSLPYPDADRLVSFGMLAPIEPNEFMLSYDYVDWKTAPGFESVAAWTGVSDCDLSEQNPVRMSCAAVESTFLPTFGIRPLFGRNFTPEENRPNGGKVALLTYGLWQSRFGGDPGALGRTISLDGQATRIVGVLPATFELPNLATANVLVPMTFTDAELSSTHSTARVVRAFARLKPGVSVTQAEAALRPHFEQSLKWVSPQFHKEVKLMLQPLRERQIHDSKLASWVLLAAVLAVLLIACANLANLLLARAAARQRELAVRTALGAGKLRLIRQTLTESVLLALLGCAAGCVLAWALLRGFLAIAPEGIPRLQQASLDGRVLLFALLISVFSGVLFGLAPALHLPSPELLAGRAVTGGRRTWFRQMLIAAQVAVSLVLLAGATLLLRTLWNLQTEPMGFTTSHVLTANIVLGQRYAQAPQQRAFWEQLEQRLQRLPGVSALALSDSLPPGGAMRAMVYSAILVRGRPRYMEGTGGMVAYRLVSPQYFRALEIPIVRGRGFTDQDRNPGEYSIILSESLARKMFGDGDPLGQQLQPGLQGPWYTVVGVAADAKNGGLVLPPDPEYYVVRGHETAALRRSSIIVRTSMSPAATAQWIRGEIAGLDATLPVSIETMDQRVGKLSQRNRFDAALLSLFAAFGLVLAAIGIYGVVSYVATQRTQEIGVRMALGATPERILRLVASQGMRPVIVGAIAGIAAALALAHLIRSLLFQVGPRDPLAYAGAALLLGLVSLLAAIVPARRAARVDPMIALRYE
ncbi:MAG TPA: ABC transporter permease [Terriglobales bacterium]|nr:ABC transporter permease [Terriglobales bacterium]